MAQEESLVFCGGRSWKLFLQIFWKYKADWLICAVMQGIGGLPQLFVEPYVAPWSLDDPSLHWRSTPGRDDNIVSSLVLLTSFGLAGIIVLAVIPAVLSRARGYFNVRESHHLALAYFYAACLETFVRGLINIIRGGLRPDFYDVCKPDEAAWSPGLQPVCTSGNDLANARRSFPCGHCSFSCATSMIYTLHLLALLDVWDGRGHIWKNVVAITPSVGAWLVSVSRISDGRHHGSDVVFGILIGTISAIIAYFTYFPWVLSEGRGQPRCVRDTLGMPPHLIHPAVTTPPIPPKYTNTVEAPAVNGDGNGNGNSVKEGDQHNGEQDEPQTSVPTVPTSSAFV